jgi:hypothetical protein
MLRTCHHGVQSLMHSTSGPAPGYLNACTSPSASTNQRRCCQRARNVPSLQLLPLSCYAHTELPSTVPLHRPKLLQGQELPGLLSLI